MLEFVSLAELADEHGMDKRKLLRLVRAIEEKVGVVLLVDVGNKWLVNKHQLGCKVSVAARLEAMEVELNLHRKEIKELRAMQEASDHTSSHRRPS